MSVDTDITSNREVTTEAIDEARTAHAELPAQDLADEDCVVAGVVLRPGAAFEPGERALQQRAASAVADVDAAPQRNRRDAAAGEVPREVPLLTREQACCEAPGPADRLVRRR